MSQNTTDKRESIGKQKLSAIQKLEEQKERLVKESKRIAENVKVLEARIAKSDAQRLREYDFKKKLHSGGMMAMVGMFEYVYSDKIRDNPQDDLMADLIVGSLLKMSKMLNSATGEQLQTLWDEGKTFRAKNKEDRIVVGKNEKLEDFIKTVETKLKATKQQPSDNVQSNAQASVIES